MKIRADWAIRLTLLAEAGTPWTCRRCQNPIDPRHHKWHLGHPPTEPVATLGQHTHDLQPEHEYCNTADGGRLSHQLRNRPAPLPPSRTW